MEERGVLTLQCPHCRAMSGHDRRDILGDWVICPACDRHYPWRDAERRVAAGEPPGRVPASDGHTR